MYFVLHLFAHRPNFSSTRLLIHVHHRVQSLRGKSGRNTGIVVVSRRIAVDSPPFWWIII